MLARHSLFQYGKLADAYLSITDGTPPDLEERTINLLNHLAWGSYQPGDDITNDEIVKAAFGLLLHSHPDAELDPELSQLAHSLGVERSTL